MDNEKRDSFMNELNVDSSKQRQDEEARIQERMKTINDKDTLIQIVAQCPDVISVEAAINRIRELDDTEDILELFESIRKDQEETIREDSKRLGMKEEDIENACATAMKSDSTRLRIIDTLIHNMRNNSEYADLFSDKGQAGNQGR